MNEAAKAYLIELGWWHLMSRVTVRRIDHRQANLKSPHCHRGEGSKRYTGVSQHPQGE